MRQKVLCVLMLGLAAEFLGARAAAKESANPKTVPVLKSVFPLGGNPGSSFEVVMRGENLEGAYAVWLDCPRLRAEIKDVREVESGKSEGESDDPIAKKEPEKAKKSYAVVLGVKIDTTADIGAHRLRLIAPTGVSNALWFLVDSEPAILETDKLHSTLTEAQSVNFPLIVNGRLAKPGELDDYSFEVAAGQQLQFEVRTTGLPKDSLSADPELTLYKPTGSWFDPNRGLRLEVTDLWRPPLDDQPYITSHRLPRVRRVFQEAGRYVVQVGTVDGQSGPDYSYQLRIVPVTRTEPPQHERWGPLISMAHAAGPVAWENRSFTSEMGPDWLSHISSRSAPAMQPPPTLAAVREKEPNDTPAKALDVPVPAIVEGAIGRPSDTDWFQIQAKAGDRLALEIETPYLPPPFFNACLTVFDPDGKELANNIYWALGGDGDDWIKTLVPKLLYTFDKAGAYRIQIRDLTTRAGSDEFAYRLVVRPQVPYLGEVTAKGVDSIHLAAGESQSIHVSADLEEGFQGEVALSVENLPPGVSMATALSGAENVNNPTAKPASQLHRERHFPQQRSAAIMLVAASDAPPTRLPQPIRIIARPILGGKTGEALPAQEILLTVAGGKKQAGGSLQGANSQ